jgi:hypothetical protein
VAGACPVLCRLAASNIWWLHTLDLSPNPWKSLRLMSSTLSSAPQILGSPPPSISELSKVGGFWGVCSTGGKLWLDQFPLDKVTTESHWLKLTCYTLTILHPSGSWLFTAECIPHSHHPPFPLAGWYSLSDAFPNLFFRKKACDWEQHLMVALWIWPLNFPFMST